MERISRDDLVADGFVSVEEARKFLGVSRAFVYQLMDDYQLESVKLGRRRLIPRRALRRLVSSKLERSYYTD